MDDGDQCKTNTESSEPNTSNKDVLVMRQEQVKYGLPNFEQENTDVKTKRKNKNESCKQKAVSNKRIRTLQEENGEMKKKLTCIVCDDSTVNIVTLPCCHLRMCKDCYEERDVKACPSCGKNIKYVFPAIISA